MDCCSVNGLDKMFSESVAQGDLKAYLKKGLSKRSRHLMDTIREQGITGATILEVGGGIGSLHLELIKAGATSAVGYDASAAYVEAATSLAEKLGLKESVEYHVGDFAEMGGSAEDADIVVLDRVLCCYPDMRALVTASAQRTRRFCVLTYPRRTWLTRALLSMANAGLALFRKRFRAYVHKPLEIAALMSSNGLERVSRDYAGTFREWEVAVYRREAESSATD